MHRQKTDKKGQARERRETEECRRRELSREVRARKINDPMKRKGQR